ncbi:sirohydrochlorin chelatase [Actinotalea solisilvae]|uniref:sirohydrochlorin chelatase n=1 Tax=Actinotalea solisilvae TaxID=2072922 RepID=UPI0018F17295|nr:CbiX/SirB N-terminal domain-containing protein [Actinotalea solisilvae]
MTAPVLVACSHGTRSPAGRAAIRRIVDDIRALRPELDVRPAHVDVEAPAVADVVSAALTGPGGGAGPVPGVVVVPLLLSTGVHVRHDIGAAVRAPRAAAARHLGPDERLVDVLHERLTEVDVGPGDAVVLAAAGSSDPSARHDVEQVHAWLAQRHSGPVTVGYCAASGPSVPEAVAQARAGGATRVVLASYLLAPGFFHSLLSGAGADAVTAPLAPHPLLAHIALDRYEERARRPQP